MATSRCRRCGRVKDTTEGLCATCFKKVEESKAAMERKDYRYGRKR